MNERRDLIKFCSDREDLISDNFELCYHFFVIVNKIRQVFLCFIEVSFLGEVRIFFEEDFYYGFEEAH